MISLEQLTEDIGEDIELDVVAIRCDWSEIHIQELWDEYSHVFENEGLTVENDSDDYDEQLRILQEHTTVLPNLARHAHGQRRFAGVLAMRDWIIETLNAMGFLPDHGPFVCGDGPDHRRRSEILVTARRAIAARLKHGRKSCTLVTVKF